MRAPWPTHPCRSPAARTAACRRQPRITSLSLVLRKDGNQKVSTTGTVIVAVVLAFLFGYGLTTRGLLRAGVGLRAALRAALAADTASIATMELVDNAVILALPGAMNAGLNTALFWASLALSLA